jgi:phospholipid-binding lipoprotein MlaA
MKRSGAKIIFAWLMLAMLSACATPQNHYDPIESTNRFTDSFNDHLDRITLKPAAQGYAFVTPKPVRTAVSNFFNNLTYFNTILNDLLQGKGGQCISDLGRFAVNSTLGFAGMVDVATSMGMEEHEEDFGQTLAVWGSSKGAYIVYPFFGPNSTRNTPDFITSLATDPLFWLSFTISPVSSISFTVAKYIDLRAQLLEASDMRDELALDPYIFTREAWRQRREYLIYDGNPPKPEVSEDDDWEEDDWGEDSKE